MSNATPATYTPRKGDRVVFLPEFGRATDVGRVYVVDRIMPVNVVILPEGGGRGVRVKPFMIGPAPVGGTPAATSQIVAYFPPLWPGQVVSVAGPGWREPEHVLFVVLGDRDNNKTRLAKLGGDEGRYWPKVPRSFITVVESPVGVLG